MVTNNIVKALKGDASLLLILPNEVGNILNIANQDWLTFEVRNKELVVKKIDNDNVDVRLQKDTIIK